MSVNVDTATQLEVDRLRAEVDRLRFELFRRTDEVMAHRLRAAAAAEDLERAQREVAMLNDLVRDLRARLEGGGP